MISDKNMEERNDAFDSAIRERLSGHEPAVPHALWTRISAELNESEEVAAPAVTHIQAPVATTPWWRVAAAAAVVLTVGAASLLYVLQPKAENAVATTLPPAVVNTQSAPAIVVKETPQVAVAATPAVAKKTTTPSTNPAMNTVVADNADNSAKEVVAPATHDQDAELASAPAVTPATTMDLGSIPAFSLKRLSAPESLNDEITIIKSAPSKKKHGKHSADEETTRVIILNKKFDSQPGIRYQLPVRF